MQRLVCCALIWRGAAFRVAFGSCSRSTLDQPLWSNILEREPQLWVWSGDVVYGDEMKSLVPFVFESGGVDGLRRHYERQNAVPDYAALVAKVPIVATWDDHDYGLNDAGRTLPFREESQRAFLDFLGEDALSPRRAQRGVYTARRFDDGAGHSVLVVALDMRFHKDPYEGAFCERCDFLGEEQWAWLDATLSASDADAHVIVSSLQLLESRGGLGESWARFPSARRRVMQMLANVSAPVIVSGDVHHAELSAAVCDSGSTLLDVTSSGMTHSWTHQRHVGFVLSHLAAAVMRIAQRVMPWRYQLRAEDGTPQYYLGLNFGELDFDFEKRHVVVRILGVGGVVVIERRFGLAELGGGSGCVPWRGGRETVRWEQLFGVGLVVALLFLGAVLSVLTAMGSLYALWRATAALLSGGCPTARAKKLT